MQRTGLASIARQANCHSAAIERRAIPVNRGATGGIQRVGIDHHALAFEVRHRWQRQKHRLLRRRQKAKHKDRVLASLQTVIGSGGFFIKRFEVVGQGRPDWRAIEVSTGLGILLGGPFANRWVGWVLKPAIIIRHFDTEILIDNRLVRSGHTSTFSNQNREAED